MGPAWGRSGVLLTHEVPPRTGHTCPAFTALQATFLEDPCLNYFPGDSEAKCDEWGTILWSAKGRDPET